MLVDIRLKEYILQNQTCSEMLFRDWDRFLEVLFECGGCVKEILWFEYVLVSEQSASLGAGGYRDASNPEYMWAETMMIEKGLEQRSLTEIRQYIRNTIKDYKPHQLVPCFFEIGE